VIRVDGAPRGSELSRRQILRLGFFAATALAATELAAAVAPFIRVTRIAGLGAKVTPRETKAEILERFVATNDDPILFAQDKFFLLHAPGGIIAAYRKCTHLGCAVPYARSEDRFHCPCHQSVYDKRTALLVSGPAPRGLDLFRISEQGARLTIDTNPFQLLVRSDNKWHDEHLEVRP
jgi:cytochrome b6-f complex iron-sulfur subunit